MGAWVPEELAGKKNALSYTFPYGQRMLRLGRRAAPSHFYGEALREWPE